MKLHDPSHTAIALFMLSFLFNLTWGFFTGDASVWESILFSVVVVIIYVGVIWAIGATTEKLGLTRK